MASAVVISADDQIRRQITRLLLEEQFEVTEASANTEALAQVKAVDPDLIVINDDLPPPESETRLLLAVRRIARGLILAIEDENYEKAPMALIQGADAYQTKPLSLPELRSRVHALMRRRKAGQKQRIVRNVGAVSLEDDHIGAQGKVSLTPAESRLFLYLADRQGQPVPADELLSQVWSYRASPQTLRYYIWRLRRKLSPFSWIHIISHRNSGYSLLLLKNGLKH